MNRKSIISYILILIIVLNFSLSVNSFNVSASSFYKDAVDIPGNASATDASYIPSDGPEVNAEAAIVMDLDTGDILYEKNPYQEKYPASITKVLTCLIAIENGNLFDTLTVSSNAMSQVEEGSSSIGLQAGEKLSMKDALYGMMLNSGNECALTIAEHVGGSVEGFADMMNNRARELGCKNSHFVNPNGLQDENHYTSCYDMAVIGRAAYQYPEFKKLISSQSYTIPETNLNEARNLWQENRLIYKGNGEYYYEFCTGGKTGYTVTSLATLIAFAEKDGKRLISVVMKCNPTTESYLDVIKLFDFSFNRYSVYRPLLDYNVNQINKNSTSLLSNYYADINHALVKYSVDNSYSFYVRSYIKDDDVTKEVNYYPHVTDGKAGSIRFLYNGELIGETDLLVDIPYLDATSTDALINKNSEPAVDSKILFWAKRVIIILLILIVILLLIILLVKIGRWAEEKETRRKVKYFPKNRDPRILEKLKKEEEKQKAKEAKKSKKKNIKSDNNSRNDIENKETEKNKSENEETVSKESEKTDIKENSKKIKKPEDES